MSSLFAGVAIGAFLAILSFLESGSFLKSLAAYSLGGTVATLGVAILTGLLRGDSRDGPDVIGHGFARAQK